MQINTDIVEQSNQKKFSSSTYSPEKIVRAVDMKSKEYADILLRNKFELVDKYADNMVVLDLCCATGLHLISMSNKIKHGIGLDYSDSYIKVAQQHAVNNKISNVEFISGNAREMPFSDNSFNLVYCFSSLYVMPKVEEVIKEIARVLKAGGICVLDFGNVYSLNTLVCKAHPELAETCHISVPKMKRIIKNSKMQIINHRAFQILPMWAEKPKWLYPLLHPWWKKLFQYELRGKMIDEWVSSLPVLKYLAFRHVFVCIKEL